MNILVCVKQVPNTKTSKIDPKLDPETKTLIREGVPAIVNPFDEFALELAARVKDANGGKIVLLSMGPEQAKAALKECLAVGGDQAYLLSDSAFAGSDTLATAYILAGAFKALEEKEGKFDLIFCGKQALDGETGQVGPGLAEYLGCAQATYVTDLIVKEGAVHARRETEDGYEIVEVQTPAVLTVTKHNFDIRYPTVKSKLAAVRAQIPTLTAKDFPIDVEKCGLVGSPTRVKESFSPQKKAGGIRIQEETGADSARKLFELLHSEHLL